MATRVARVTRADRAVWSHWMLPVVVIAALVAIAGVTLGLAVRAFWSSAPPVPMHQLAALVPLVVSVSSLLHWLVDRICLLVPVSGHVTLSLATLLLAFSITPATMSGASWFLIWGPILATEAMWTYRLAFVSQNRGQRRSTGTEPRTAEPRTATDVIVPVSATSQAASALSPLDDLPDTGGEVIQQSMRVRTADGEQISGVLRAFLLAEQRSETLHVSFCPPLHVVPEVTVEQLAGPQATVKVGEVQTYGARFELRLTSMPRQPVTVTIRWRSVAGVPAQITTATAAQAVVP